MIQRKIIGTFKIITIIFLVIVIALVAIIQWKGDAIMEKVIGNIENQLEDSLHFEALHLEWFSYFPSVALRIDGLKLGPDNEPLIEGGHVDIILRLFPLFKEKIVINRLLISGSRFNIIKRNSRWSYEVFKKSENQSEAEWNALVNQVNLEKTNLVYNDHEDLYLSIDIREAKLEGILSGKMLDADIEMQGSLADLITGSYKLQAPFSFDLSGNYKHDLTAGTQEYNNWKIKNEGIDLAGNGSTHKEKDQQFIEADISWKNGNMETLKQFIPIKNIKDWEDYTFSGDTEGQIKINGNSSKNEIPHITLSSVLKNGSIKFPGQEGLLKDIILNLSYDNGDVNSKTNSFVLANLKKGSFRGNSLKADIRINELDHPELALDLEGSLPAGILNLFSSSSGIHFQSGVFDIDHLKIKELILKTVSLKTFIEKSETKLVTENVRFSYKNDQIEIQDGDIRLEEAGKMKVIVGELIWNKAKGEDIEGEIIFTGDNVDFTLTCMHSQGQVDTKGSVTGLGMKPVLKAEWKVTGIEMKELLASFSNFDQTFITQDNLNGKADVWTEITIPYDANGNIITRDIIVRAAVDIRDGELKGMKILEDFSKYIHLDDLRDIRFSEFRNYLKIEDGKVYLPVMFIQSSAINMSINGVHSFDQHILYNLKINAGQAITNKLRKHDPSQRFKQARKSGWINLYYVLSGTASLVQYQQDQKEVLSGFEQSAALKENLRSYLVDHFGYDVYWLEPNEWEDIPEYK